MVLLFSMISSSTLMSSFLGSLRFDHSHKVRASAQGSSISEHQAQGSSINTKFEHEHKVRASAQGSSISTRFEHENFEYTAYVQQNRCIWTCTCLTAPPSWEVHHFYCCCYSPGKHFIVIRSYMLHRRSWFLHLVRAASSHSVLALA